MRSSNVVWQNGGVDRKKREDLLGQKGVCLWFTGLSGSGKSTLARGVENALYQRGHIAYVLDGDNIRHGLNGDLGFSVAERKENIRRIGEVSRLFVDTGIITLTAFISPFHKDRNTVRELIPPGRFIEIYVNCPLEVCEERDVKGLYTKARKHEIEAFTGISSPYETPEAPEIIVDTKNSTSGEAVEHILEYLLKKHIIEAS
ncbi:MAG: adenylyl-sulfate kinase [Candidatus Marinimicrobia bacterium]|nr:adenylyl-sulfate kinase [Candidatus Neomarinimicrobiota bacterium]